VKRTIPTKVTIVTVVEVTTLNGTNQYKEKTGVDNSQTLKGGNDPEYLTARIARDRPYFPARKLVKCW
jgi:hypothetical protein